MYRKRFEKRYWIVLILVSVAVILSILFFTVQDDRNLSFPEKALKDSVLFVEKIFMTPIRFVQDKIDEIKTKNNVFEKYEKLKKEYEETELLEAKYQEARKEIDMLKQTLDLQTSLSEYSYLHASVIARNIDYWYQTITIDKGSKNGVEKGMAVITSEGLIGTVISVTSFNSTVKLLTGIDTNHMISVKIESLGHSIYGLLSTYNSDDNTYTVEGISENTEIEIGSFLVTTGLGNEIPSGILIGKVKEIKTDHFDLARTVIVESSVDFDNLRYVTILKGKIDS